MNDPSMDSELILALWNFKTCLCRAVQFWAVFSLWSSVINLMMQCNAVAVNCGIRPSLNCFHRSITEERLKTWRKTEITSYTVTQVYCAIISINISHIKCHGISEACFKTVLEHTDKPGWESCEMVDKF